MKTYPIIGRHVLIEGRLRYLVRNVEANQLLRITEINTTDLIDLHRYPAGERFAGR